MGIYVGKETKLLVQGITGKEGMFHTFRMLEYGTNVVGGVVPGKGGDLVWGVPVFDTVREARGATGANASVVFVPPAFARDSVLEAVDAGLDLVVCITEGIPVRDMAEAVPFIERSRTRLIGPNCPGIVTPGECLAGILPGNIFRPGPVGIISRSGTLTYEVVAELSARGIGQSTCMGIGGDPIIGTTFIDALREFEKDSCTKCIVMVGEIGGSDEEIAAEYIKSMNTPVVGFISGMTAPPGKRMGHAGAIVSGKSGTAGSKVQALSAAGVTVAETISEIADEVERLLSDANPEGGCASGR